MVVRVSGLCDKSPARREQAVGRLRLRLESVHIAALGSEV